MSLRAALEARLGGEFVIERELARGGTSRVYVARRTAGGERIVIKAMRRTERMGGRDADCFLLEMRILQKLNHPRIIRVLELGQADGALFFTMPHYEGETVRARLARVGPLAVAEALVIARDVLAALGHAHANGVVHRDVKPDNIMLAEGEGGAILMDFGYALAPSLDQARQSDSRLIVGTPDYMSPEQVSGRRTADGRSDFYSLGCVLFEMLTGAPPFAAGSARASMERRVTESPPDVRTLRPDVPEDVASILRRALDPHPTGRFSSAGSMTTAIEAALERAAPAAPAHPGQG